MKKWFNRIILLLLFFYPVAAFSQNRTINGKVVDENGEPLIGAGIVSQSGKRGTVSDIDGKYVLSLDVSETIISVSYIGYATQNIVIGERQVIDIQLSPDTSNRLNDAVVIGYGTIKKQDLTGSVANLKVDEVETIPVVSVDQAMQGRIAGVEIVSASGEPGGETSIRIRGTRSISASNEPLIVVDGVMDAVMSLSDINPSDIASVSVLKDASSTAIYGSRGSNGVIMVTTKAGTTSRPSVKAKALFGVSQIARKLDIMNAEEFIRYRNDRSSMQGYPTYDIKDYENDTDWVDTITRLALYQNYSVSLSGKEKTSNYYSSLTYTDEQGIVKDSGIKRFTGRVNISKSFAKWITLNFKVSGTYQHRDHNKAQIGGSSFSNGAIYLSPLLGPLDIQNPLYENGALINTPYASILYEEYFSKQYSHNYIAEVVLKPVKGLVIKSQNSSNNSTLYKYHAWPSTMPKKDPKEGADATKYEKEYHKLASENTITYKPTLPRGNFFDIMVGFSVSSYKYNYNTLTAKGLLEDNFKWNNFGGIGSKENYTISSSTSKTIKESVFGRINYNYQGRYYFTATVRGDGSSNFAANHKWGFFPSGAFKWNVKGENFMRAVKSVNQLELRIGAGRTGNDAISAYESLQAYGITTSGYIFDGAQGASFYPSRLDNPNLTWEKTDEYNVAIEGSFLKNRVSFNFEAYYARTTDLLLKVPVNRVTGYTSYLDNLGETSNRGVELTIDSKNVETKRFGWSTAFTISHNRQKVLNIGGESYVSTVTSPGTVNYMMYGYKAGYPVNALWGFEYAGTIKSVDEFTDNIVNKQYGFQSNLNESNCLGHSKYVDQNHDGVLDNNDLVYLGDGDPLISGGLQNNFQIGNLKISFFFEYSYGGKIYNYAQLAMGGGGYTNQYRFMLNSWHPMRNPNSDIPKAGDSSNYLLPSSYMVYDSSFIRFKDFTVQYRFDMKERNKVFKGITIGATASNLYLWTNYIGYDPDVSSETDSGTILRRVDMATYPTTRKVVLSLQLDF